MKTFTRMMAALLCLVLLLSACGTTTTPSSAGSSTASSSPASGSASTPAGSTLSPGDIIQGPTGADIAGGWSDTVAERKLDPETIHFVLGQDSGNLDPQNNQLIVGIMIEKHIFDTLIVKDPLTGEFMPGLATSWEWVDQTHLKMTLREGVKFHNGEDFTSEDVLKMVEKLATGSATAALYKNFSLAESSANGDYEVTIGFSDAFAPALNYLAHTRSAIVPADYLAEHGPEALFQQPVGTGAYKFVLWNVGTETHLERNDDWWGKAEGYGDCYFKYIKVNHSGETGPRAIALEAGAVDIAAGIESTDFTNIYEGNIPHLLATKVSGYQVNHISFNWSFEAFQDIRVRQALAYAVDWPTTVDVAGGLTITFTDSCVAPTVSFYNPTGTYGFDPEKAKELLKEAGYETLTVEAVIQEGGSGARIMEIIQAYWADVGVTMEIVAVDGATWVESITNGTCDMSLMNMTAMTEDPAHTLMQIVGDATNITGRIPDERFNELASNGLKELDQTKRAQIYADLQKQVYDNVLQIPMFVQNITYGYWDYLDGVIPDPGQQLDMRRISLKS